MLQLKKAMELTTSHGLPRVVTNKPLLVRLLWLLMFLFMLALFLKGFYDFGVKLQSRQVTNTLEANSLNFQFPDVYVCFENPISGSYSANIDAKSAGALNAQLNATRRTLQKLITGLPGVSPGIPITEYEAGLSYVYPQSIPYDLLINILAHRKEQDVITSDVTYNTDYGMSEYQPINADTFYHPMFLSCLKWTLNSTWQSKVVQTGSTSGIVLTLNTDNNFTGINSTGADILQVTYARRTPLPLSDWSLSVVDFNGCDRRSGIRVFLTPPGEYPSDFVTSFSLGPGKYHTVEIEMTQQVYKDGQFGCVSDAPDVQFVNPYDQSPYTHAYSYSHCYYYEYHKQFQELVNMSGIIGPLPWSLRGKKYVINVTGEPTFFVFITDSSLAEKGNAFDKKAKAACETKRPCSTLAYSVSISNTDWPTQSSLTSFVSSSVKQVWWSAKAKNQSVPALDFLVTSNASTATSYVHNNMLKVHLKPYRVLCDRVTFSIDYGVQNFISDIGGIMGIYLGMSLLTMCELLELFYDLVAFGRTKAMKSNTKTVAVAPSPKTATSD